MAISPGGEVEGEDSSRRRAEKQMKGSLRVFYHVEIVSQYESFLEKKGCYLVKPITLLGVRAETGLWSSAAFWKSDWDAAENILCLDLLSVWLGSPNHSELILFHPSMLTLLNTSINMQILGLA